LIPACGCNKEKGNGSPVAAKRACPVLLLPLEQEGRQKTLHGFTMPRKQENLTSLIVLIYLLQLIRVSKAEISSSSSSSSGPLVDLF